MEKTLDELLYEKLHILMRNTRKGHRRPPMPGMMPGRMPGMPGMHRPEEGMMRKWHEGEPHKHRPMRFPRERILALILEKENGVHQKELAEEMHINPSSISELIDKLEADRYIERTVDPADKRATLITLTEKGKARAYEVKDERVNAAAEVFRNLSDEEKQTLLVLLDKITADKD